MERQEIVRKAQAKWYRKQKTKGSIYLLQIGPETYVGSTTNSLPKRLWQHRSGVCKYVYAAYLKYGEIQINLLEQAPVDLLVAEQLWIERLHPTLNKYDVIRKDHNKHCYKGGIEYEGVWYPTKKQLWETKGQVPYGTFKRRLHTRPNDLDFALNY